MDYEPLRKICLKILRHEELKYGTEKDKIYGILFDVSYLWEEYIALLLKKLNFKHPENTASKGAIELLKNNNSWKCYPDFYNDKIVMDAKYKKIDNIGNIATEDRYQLLTYMYILELKHSLFLHPVTNNDKDPDIAELKFKNKNRDEKNTIGIYHFKIPQNVLSMEDFCSKIIQSEHEFTTYMQKYQ